MQFFFGFAFGLAAFPTGALIDHFVSEWRCQRALRNQPPRPEPPPKYSEFSSAIHPETVKILDEILGTVALCVEDCTVEELAAMEAAIATHFSAKGAADA